MPLTRQNGSSVQAVHKRASDASEPSRALALPPTDPWLKRWSRRAITGPGLVVLTLVELTLLPALLCVAALLDLWKRRGLSHVRFVLAITYNLWLHIAGLAVLWASWLVGGHWLGLPAERQRRLDKAAQGWWARQVWRGAARVYRLRLEIRGTDAFVEGGFVLMPRHASILDTVLPLVLLADARGYRLRYVVKRELLWDPCIDLAGDRFPTAFVRRGGADHQTEIDRVLCLIEDLGPEDVVVIFPEGTRYSLAKRERVLRSLQRKQPETARWAAKLRHLLPPHPGGTHALLRSGEHDVVFCAHTGLEPANHFADMLDGRLLDATVKLQFWRVPAAELPSDPIEREHWLRGWWDRIDDWIEVERARPADH